MTREKVGHASIARNFLHIRRGGNQIKESSYRRQSLFKAQFLKFFKLFGCLSFKLAKLSREVFNLIYIKIFLNIDKI